MSDNKLNTYREATASGRLLHALIECTKEEWLSKEKMSSSIQPYRSIRDELTFVKGLALKWSEVLPKKSPLDIWE